MSLRVVVVGLGWAARTIWVPRVAAHPDLVLTALADPDPAARAACAVLPGGSGPVPELLASADELAADQVDLAIVAVPNHAHSRVTCGLLRRGIPVFLEKPVCLSTAEADELAAAERSGALLIAGSAARYRADVRALERVVPSLGRIRHVRVAWVRRRGVPGTHWFTRRHTAGGGALVDLGWHLLDTALPLLGAGDVTFPRVAGTVGYDFVDQGEAQAAWRAEPEGRGAVSGGDVEDTARAFLVTDTGVSFSVHTSWASHAEHDSTLVEVHGSRGLARLDSTFGFSPDRRGSPVLTVHRNGTAETIALPDEPVGAEYDRQVDALPALLADPDQPGRAVRAARTTIHVIERIYASALGRAAEPAGTPAGVAAPALRGVIFDLDGTIADSFGVMREAFCYAYREVVGGGEPPFGEYSRHLGRYFPDIMTIMGLPLEMEEPFVRESYRLAGKVRLYDGIPELLRQLRARGIRCAVATGKSGERARSLLESLGVLELFDHVVGSDEVARPKPAPDVVERAVELLGVGKDEAVMIGDAETDIASANTAGVAAVAALWGEEYPQPILGARPDAVMDSPGEFLRWCLEKSA